MSTRDWKAAYAAMHRDGEAAFPPAALHYILELVRRETRVRAEGVQLPDFAPALTPADIVSGFRKRARTDVGPLLPEVLEDWSLRTPEELGRAVLLLGRYDCLSLDPSDTLEAFTADARPLGEKVS